MRCSLALALALCAVVSTGCAQQPELPADQPLPESWGATPAGGAALTEKDPADAVTAAYDRAVKASGIRLVSSAKGSELDMRYSPGRVVGRSGSGAGRAELRRIGDVVYVKASPFFWRHTAVSTSADRLGTSWVRLRYDAENDRTGGSALVTDLEDYLGRVLEPGSWDRWGARKSVRGVPAIAVTDDDRPEVVLYLATTGEPRPLLIVARDGTTFEFRDYGMPARTEAPAGALDGDRLPAG